MNGDTELLIDRGDLPSLAACATRGESQRLVLWHLLEPDAAAGRRREAVIAHARAWSVERIIEPRATDLGVPGMAPPAELFEGSMLLQAVVAARQIGSARVIWPRRTGPDPDAVTAMVERVEAVAALAHMPGERRSVEIEMPVLDLTEMQVAELAEDAGAPMRAFWPCRGGGEMPCGHCPECLRWLEAFRSLGFAWPWAEVASASA